MKRQALYACLTCTPVAPEIDMAGICLACCLSCHDGHELVELYTKRYSIIFMHNMYIYWDQQLYRTQNAWLKQNSQDKTLEELCLLILIQA